MIFFGQRTPDRQNGPKMVPKVPETTRKTAPKVPKWPKKGPQTSVQRRSKSTYGTTRHMQFTYRSIFVKCRFTKDTSETSFRSLCKMAFLAPRRTKKAQKGLKMKSKGSKMKAKKAQKWSKKSPKRPQKGLRMGSKRHQNDPK